MPTINRNHVSQKQIPYKHERQSDKYYNTTAWKQLRLTYKMKNPLCEVCLQKGIIRPVEHIHHKKEILSGRTEDERQRLLLDWNNLQSVCVECHRNIHKSRG